MAAQNQNAFSHQTTKGRYLLISAVCVLLAIPPISVFADSTFVPSTLEVTGTNAPYAILGVNPGVSAVSARESFGGHFGDELADEIITLNVRSSNGREFQHEYVQRLVSPWVAANTFQDLPASFGFND